MDRSRTVAALQVGRIYDSAAQHVSKFQAHPSGDTDVVQFLARCFMRDFLIPLVLIVVVVAGVWLYLETTASHAGAVVATVPASTDLPAPPPKLQPHPKRASAQNSAEVAAASVPAPAPVKVEEKPAAPPPPPRPIPTGTPDQVNPGMEVSKVVELLGQPDLTALSIRRGSLSETYIYKKKPGQNLAFIRLEGGRVVTPQ